ncbi:hypothetical protein KM043_002077 [Ampulex compressa]|nr:hypothetical protein KM043_002077 [Ampulex compressa]
MREPNKSIQIVGGINREYAGPKEQTAWFDERSNESPECSIESSFNANGKLDLARQGTNREIKFSAVFDGGEAVFCARVAPPRDAPLTTRKVHHSPLKCRIY